MVVATAAAVSAGLTITGAPSMRERRKQETTTAAAARETLKMLQVGNSKQ